MKELKKKIKSFSCYRKVYIFTLFFVMYHFTNSCVYSCSIFVLLGHMAYLL